MEFAADWGLHSAQSDTSAPQPFPLLSLPVELQDMIISTMPHTTCLSLSATCRSFRMKILPRIFRGLRITNDPLIAEDQLAFIRRHRGIIRHISFIPQPILVDYGSGSGVRGCGGAYSEACRPPEEDTGRSLGPRRRPALLVRSKRGQMYDRSTGRIIVLSAEDSDEYRIAFPAATKCLLSGSDPSLAFASLTFHEDEDFRLSVTIRDFDRLIGSLWKALRSNTMVRRFKFTGTDLYLHMLYTKLPAPFLDHVETIDWGRKVLKVTKDMFVPLDSCERPRPRRGRPEMRKRFYQERYFDES